MKDIAQRAAVSPATVSYVLNNRQRTNGSISEETRQRVLRVATEMGYRTHELAKAIATGKHRVLGVVVEPLMVEHQAHILTGIIEEAAKLNYMVKVLPLSSSQSSEGIVERAQEWRIAGLISVALLPETCGSLRREALTAHTPLSIVSTILEGISEIATFTDNEQGTRLLFEHLVELGHQHIGFLGGTPQNIESQQREDVFRALLAEKNLPIVESWIRQSDWSDITIIENVSRDILSGERPTAVICAGDPLAVVLINVARQLGVQLPNDLSVTGYANFFMSKFLAPSLTTIDQNFRSMGQIGVHHLIKKLEPCTLEDENHDALSKIETLIPTRLIVRASTAPPR